MINFYLIRHGQKEAIPFDPPLTKIGVKQAEITAELLKDIDFKKIIVSPKLRTKQTAEIIAMPHSLEISTDNRLIERLEWESDKSFDEFISEWNKTDIDRSYQPKMGLSSSSNGEQMRRLLNEFSARYGDGNILMVTHGGTIGDLLRNLFTEDVIEHKIDPITGAPHIQISECSLTVIEEVSDKYSLAKINDNSHLAIT